MKKISNVRDGFVLKIQSLYDIEKQLEKALPKLAKAATDPELKQGFLDHLEETKGHSERLEQIFKILDSKPKKQKCEGIRGIVLDGTYVTEVQAPVALHDSMIAGAARYAEHYEIAGYLSAIEEAKFLKMESTVRLLEETLAEEEEADKKLMTAMKKCLSEVLGEE